MENSDSFVQEELPLMGGEDPKFLSHQIITYIGNKRSLLAFIGEGIDKAKTRLGKKHLRSIDMFSGSGVVARYLKKHSSLVHANDIERYAEIGNLCYLSNRPDVDIGAIKRAVTYVNQSTEKNLGSGFISELYAPNKDSDIKIGERVFYTRRNAQFIDTARQVIDSLEPEVRDFVLAPLIYKASVHTNTSGVFKGFYKNSKTGRGQFGGNGKYALTRIMQDISIPLPIFSNYSCECIVTRQDANQLIQEAKGFDLAYIDPPYNQHPYGSNYFMLNLIADYARPEDISAVSGIPTNWNRSNYNKRGRIKQALTDLVANLDAKFILVSFNSEGYISKTEMTSILSLHGKVEILSTAYNTFRGSRNLRGRDIHVTEYLFLMEKN